MEKKWFSPKGQGLWFSIIIREPESPEKALPLFNTLLSVAIMESILKKGIRVNIKWPNDLLLNGKKVCGILSEVKRMGRGISLIAGIGINTGKNIKLPSELLSATSSLELDGDRAREGLLKEILENVEKIYKGPIGDREIMEKYILNSSTIGSSVFLLKEKTICKAVGIGSSGELILQNSDGLKKTVYSGEEIRRKIL